MLFPGKYSDHSLNNPDQHYAFSVANSSHQICVELCGRGCDHTHIILFFRTDMYYQKHALTTVLNFLLKISLHYSLGFFF